MRPMRIPAPLRHTSFLLAALVLVLVVVAIPIVRNRPQPAAPFQSIAGLAASVESYGEYRQLFPPVEKFFGIPIDDTTGSEVTRYSKNGGKRAITAHCRRESGIVDLLLMYQPPGGDAAYFCYATDAGQLVSAIYLDSKPRSVDDAEKKFEHERDFWFSWQREILKHPPRGNPDGPNIGIRF
jgi:hypothetical protein